MRTLELRMQQVLELGGYTLVDRGYPATFCTRSKKPSWESLSSIFTFSDEILLFINWNDSISMYFHLLELLVSYKL